MKAKSHKASRQETVIGAVILIVLFGISMGVFRQQFRFNPAVRLHQAVADGETVADTAQGNLQPIQIPFPKGMRPMTPPERFSAANLYEKINGKAELYLAAGFRELRCGRFSVDASPEFWLEAFVYEMDSAANAVSVYSRQRREDGIPTDLSDFSYQTGNAIFLAQGSFYLEIIGAQVDPAMMQWMHAFAGHFIRSTGTGDTVLKEVSLFPDGCADKANISIISSGAFGFDRLDNVYTSACTVDGIEVMMFLSDRGSAENALETEAAYADFLKAFGGKVLETSQLGPDARMIEIFDTFELFFTAGNYFCGIHEAASAASAESAGALLSGKLNEMSK